MLSIFGSATARDMEAWKQGYCASKECGPQAGGLLRINRFGLDYASQVGAVILEKKVWKAKFPAEFIKDIDNGIAGYGRFRHTTSEFGSLWRRKLILSC